MTKNKPSTLKARMMQQGPELRKYASSFDDIVWWGVRLIKGKIVGITNNMVNINNVDIRPTHRRGSRQFP
jgi:hypothetical protein